ncbi:LacI family DNA-binding transcriptional regulator [Streptomyces tsukubensis]|uniref:LacI family transcriptional regulator n=1 Tax=Streptomyces tsukubensis TaxID=83656 RepID=A0A1V4AEG3_9ACTN|nr:LacI family transcriptional regulator [Streptomyces tsukubensis]QFR97562.1 LacI family DNA-binding transcriptional regulator [Streptomyces tsukubensis]
MARLAGVSQATVSLVLADKKNGATISEETRRKVLDAARSLGYVPDPAARRLAAARNNLLGVFSFTATFPTDVEHSYYPFLVGIEKEAAAHGYDLVLFTGSSTGGAGPAGPEALSRVRLADGCLFLGRHAPADDLARLVADGFPAVHLGRRDEPEGLPWVGADYVSASRDVVRHLAELGHRRVLLVREDDEAPASSDRERGFREGLREAGLPQDEAVFRSAAPEVDVTAERLLGWVAEGVTALVVEETDTAGAWRSVLGAAELAALDMPGALSLALLGSPPADLADRPVPTGFDIPRPELGAAAVRLLASLVAGEEGGEPLVGCVLRPGATAGPPPSAAGPGTASPPPASGRGAGPT